MADFWEEEHGENTESGSDWKADAANPYEEFILDFLENYEAKMPEKYAAMFKSIIDAVLEREWYLEESETTANAALFAVTYTISLGVPVSLTVAKSLSAVISQCVRDDIKAENERN